MPIPIRSLSDFGLVARLLIVAVGSYSVGIGANVLLGEFFERSFHYFGIESSGTVVVDVGSLLAEGTFVVMSLSVVAEELIFRTVGFAVLRGEGLSNFAALVLTSLAFGACHFQGGYVQVIVATVGGLLLGGLYLLHSRHGFIRSAAAHMAVNHVSYAFALLYPEAVARGGVSLPVWGYGLAILLLVMGLWVTIRASAGLAIVPAR